MKRALSVKQNSRMKYIPILLFLLFFTWFHYLHDDPGSAMEEQ